MDNIFIQLAIILGMSSTLGYIVVRLKLPLIIAYLFGGLLISTAALFDVHSSQVLLFLPEIGIAFVLFLVGMELDLREIKNLGTPIIVSSVLQIIVTTILGSGLARFFGFSEVESWFLGVGLAFSSTIVVVKILLDKKELTSLFGKLALGILLLEDLVAVLILLGMTVSASVFGFGYQEAFPIFTFTLKVVLLFALAVLLNRYFLSNLFNKVSSSPELLFLTALAWCFIFVSLALVLGFSVVIGAFLAGVALASSPYHFQIQGKIKPLRDFFVTLFFVYLGTQVNFAKAIEFIPLIFALTFFAVFIKPILFMLILGAFGFKKHTIFQTGISLSSISEFSLILILVGFKQGLTTTEGLSVIAMVGVLSIVTSSVLITHSKRLYKLMANFVDFFERKDTRHEAEKGVEDGFKSHVVVIGGHRVGGEILRFLKKEKIDHICLDFNPDQVNALKREGIKALYGDMGDPEVLDELHLSDAKLIISTSNFVDDNLLLLEDLKTRKINIPVIVRAESADDAKVLYKKGADFVIIPEILAGDLLTEKLKDHINDDYFKDRGKIEMEKLERKTLAWE